MKVRLIETQDGQRETVATGETVAVPRIGETVGVYGIDIAGSTTREFNRYKVIDVHIELYDEEALVGSGKPAEIPPKEILVYVVHED